MAAQRHSLLHDALGQSKDLGMVPLRSIVFLWPDCCQSCSAGFALVVPVSQRLHAAVAAEQSD